LALHLFIYMQTLFYFIASVVLIEGGYFLWLLIDREHSLRQDDVVDIGLLDSIREEFRDG
jgi:drug/metabolite transporter superfamily protein YnfA|tara:strand:+ start:319 stop:498 length:180 start_codon:yes stop_codon:yes gene_type:complete